LRRWGTGTVRFENLGNAERQKIFPRRFINSEKTEDATGNFYWVAARNCVRFYLSNKRLNINPEKYHSFQRFLSLPAEQARESNVWRWYFRTGGHPPYDPFKEY
jgi:hypothetical protein